MPHPYKCTLIALLLLFIVPISNAQVHILFDATKGEMAGNADWVMDADQTTLGVGSGGPYLTSTGHQSNPQQIPTPAQSTVTTGTSETYWTGALSSWGIDCVNRGYVVETLPWNGQISYGNTSNTQDLSLYQVFIIDEPNIKFTASEKTALLQFVSNGGGLFIISDHNGSDRNGDGWDSPAIWNDFFSSNSVAVNPFGITFDLVDFSQTTTNVIAVATDSIIHGPAGNVSEAQWAGGTTMTLDPVKNPSIKGVIYKTGAAAGNTNVMVAYGHYGNGKVAAIGDSSPTDDGTGNPNCTLYNGYWADAAGNHRPLLMNTTIWLATHNGTTGINTYPPGNAHISLYPNPAESIEYLATDHSLTNVHIFVYDIVGSLVYSKTIAQFEKDAVYCFSFTKGVYVVKIESDQLVSTSCLIVR